jgi:DNA-binding NtrC family response regulator
MMSQHRSFKRFSLRSSFDARCVVCEREGRWAVALRRALERRKVVPRQTRSIDECEAELKAAPASLLAVELTETNLDGILELLARVTQHYPKARTIILAERGLRSHEWLLREAGALHFETSPRRIERLASVIYRHLARAPKRASNLSEAIWNALPWSN